MPKLEVMRSKKQLSPEQVERLSALADRIDRDEGEAIRSKARAYRRESLRLRQVFAALRAERKRQGLSLADVAERSGMGKGRLSRLENDPHPNVTMETVERFAEALGKEITIGLTERGAA